MYINLAIVGGYLTRDPIRREFPRPDGSTFGVTDIGIALNRRYNNRTTGQRREETTFVDVNIFGRFGEIVAEKFKKGMPILIKGRLRFRTWEQDGVTRSKIDIYCEDFSFVPDGTRPDELAAQADGNLPPDMDIPLPPEAMGTIDEDMGGTVPDIPF